MTVSHLTEKAYPRHCDECRRPYEHLKGAPTGYCPQCAERMAHIAREHGPLPDMTAFHLPLLRRFER